VLAGLAAPLLALAVTAPAALASVPGPYHPAVTPVRPGPAPVRTIVVGGMPGWQISLIAIGAAALAATAAVLLDRAWDARRGVTARAA
jgi:hypothetical protein